jgi:hypothetical protein
VDESLRVRIAGGARYLGAALAEEPTRALVAAVALAAVLALVFAPRRLERVFDVRDAGERAALALAAALPLGAAAIALAEGGDGFPGQRILVAFRPFEATLLFLAARAAYRWRRALASEARAAAAVVVVALVGHFAGDARWGALEPTTYHGRDWLAARSGFELGERLERLFGAGSERPLVGVLAAGAAAYTYSGPSRDLLALNDPVMAHATRRRRGFHGHSAFSARGFFADPPVLFPLAALHCTGDPAERTARQHVLRGMGGIDRDPRFVRAYRLVQIDAPATGEPTLCTYARIDWLEGAGRPWRWSPVDDRPRAERQAAAARARIAAERPKGAG